MGHTPFFYQNMAERRRRAVDRIEDMTCKDTTLSGRHLVSGVGELTFDVVFPVTFSVRPTFHYGAELEEGNFPVAGVFPGARACVVGWEVVGKVDHTFDGYFSGATIAATTYGDDGQNVWIHWSFRGTAMRNPINVIEDIDGGI